MNNTDSHVRAILKLIQDDNVKVASLAMEQFLKLDGDLTEKLLAEHQESVNPRLRHRIHQLSSIFRRRRMRLDFIKGIRSQRMGTWEGLCRINTLYDPRCSPQRLLKSTDKLVAEMKQANAPALSQIAAIMRQNSFSVPEEEVVDIELYLVESVMETRFGSSVVLCALAHYTASLAGWRGAVVLHEGRFCLIDRKHRILDPAAGWNISIPQAADMVHPCAPRDLWLAVLTQLFLIALVEGHLRDLHHFGSLLSSLNGHDIDLLPEPLGRG